MSDHLATVSPQDSATGIASAILAHLRRADREAGAGATLISLVRAGLDRLPMPGSGDTLGRWRALASVASFDLSLVKLYEGHTDALAILAELAAPTPPAGSTWGTWAAEAPGCRVLFEPDGEGRVRLTGRKAWCSGAKQVTHGLLTAWREGDDGPFLVAVELAQRGVRIGSGDDWRAVGMAASESVEVSFDRAVAAPIGASGDYLTRPGFWHGGCGIAACWYGGATMIADALRQSAGRGGAHRLAALGAVDVALAQAGALLREAAAVIDVHPAADSQALALRVRASAEDAATAVLHHAGRALGATPFCRDANFARMAADLPVYLRQSHAERDLEALGGCVGAMKESAWRL